MHRAPPPCTADGRRAVTNQSVCERVCGVGVWWLVVGGWMDGSSWFWIVGMMMMVVVVGVVVGLLLARFDVLAGVL